MLTIETECFSVNNGTECSVLTMGTECFRVNNGDRVFQC